MELCRLLNIKPYHAVVITGLDLPSKGSTAKEVTEAVIPLIKDDVGDVAANYYIIHSPTGDITDKMVLEFSNEASQRAFEDKVEQGIIKLNNKNCKVQSAYRDVPAAAPVEGKREMQLIRRLKPFSGAGKPGPGECSITDWIAAARQLMEPDVPLTDAERLRFMKNSLIKDALTLVLSGNVRTPQDLLDMISKSYGAHRSPEQLRFKLYQLKQEDKERPSSFLARIQAIIAEIDTIEHGFLGDNDYIRLLQFHMGLQVDDHNQLNVYCNIKERLHTKQYPIFPDLFQMVQDYEREQEERNERLGKKGPRPVQCGAVYATNQNEQNENKSDTSDPQAVDLKQVLKELKSLQVKVDTHLKSNATPKQNPNAKPKPKKPQPQVQCGNITTEGAQGVRNFQAPPKPQTSWQPRADEPKVFRGKCYNCREVGHTMVMCPMDLDMDKVKANVDEVKLLIARRKASEEAQDQQELPHNEGNE